MLEEALTEHDAEGSYYDLLLFLLGAILRTHQEEEEEEGLDGTHDHEPLVDMDDDGDEKSQATVSASATMAAAWPMQHQGKPLHELLMDPFTVPELLRLHLLSSGARIGVYLIIIIIYVNNYYYVVKFDVDMYNVIIIASSKKAVCDIQEMFFTSTTFGFCRITEFVLSVCILQ